MILEKMSDFFEKRLDGYDAHMLQNIESAEEFYPFTAHCLPSDKGSHILDLGCGTGLELAYYFRLVPDAQITGIDLSAGMLKVLQTKFPQKRLHLICGSYFDVDFGIEQYDGAVSVESLHHFTGMEKIPLYKKLWCALKCGSCFVLTDYFSGSEEEEHRHRENFQIIKAENGIEDQEFYHYDTPLTIKHEMECLAAAGFSDIKLLRSWGATHTLVAYK